MMDVRELTPILQTLLLLIALAEAYFAIYTLGRALLLRARGDFLLRLSLSGVASVFIYLLLCADLRSSPVPVPVLVGALILLPLVHRYGSRALDQWKTRNLTMMSVKEGIDSLPAGLCFYWEDGAVKAVNTLMEKLCFELTGHALLDGVEFREALLSADVSENAASGENPIIPTGDGTVYSVRFGQIDLKGETLFQIIASDITEEYRLNIELQEKEILMRYRNARLKALSETIRIMAMEQEALNTKIRIHDQLGRLLLMTKRYLLKPEELELHSLLEEWRLNAVLLGTGAEIWQKPYFLIKEQVAALGLRLSIDGKLPEEGHLQPVVESAIMAHATNVIRHAGGSEARVSVTDWGSEYRLSFTNDGEAPKKKVVETGGLLNLRREIEAIGGRMTIEDTPEFKLELELPKEVSGNGIQSSYRG